jgi:hypothetical protein
MNKEVKLDGNESLQLSVIGYKELAARRSIELAKRELDDCNSMKRQLIDKIGKRSSIPAGYLIQLDIDRKVAIISKEKPTIETQPQQFTEQP